MIRRGPRLPGVGPYIAGAVLSFAFDRPEPIVEANSQRVLARLIALREDVKSSTARRRIWQVAGRLVPPRGAGDFNQALMDLGALVCTPRQPSCLFCPVAAHCEARRLGLQDVIPRTTPKPRPTAVSEACAVVGRIGRILIVQRGRGATLGAVLGIPDDPRRGARSRRTVVRRPGRSGRGRPTPHRDYRGDRSPVGDDSLWRHQLSRHDGGLAGRGALGHSRAGPGLIDARWVEPERLGDFTFSSAGRRLIARIQREPGWPSPE